MKIVSVDDQDQIKDGSWKMIIKNSCEQTERLDNSEATTRVTIT